MTDQEELLGGLLEGEDLRLALRLRLARRLGRLREGRKVRARHRAVRRFRDGHGGVPKQSTRAEDADAERAPQTERPSDVVDVEVVAELRGGLQIGPRLPHRVAAAGGPAGDEKRAVVGLRCRSDDAADARDERDDLRLAALRHRQLPKPSALRVNREVFMPRAEDFADAAAGVEHRQEGRAWEARAGQAWRAPSQAHAGGPPPQRRSARAPGAAPPGAGGT